MAQPPITVLHVVGGIHFAGGTESFVQHLAEIPIPGMRQCIWVHRAFQPPGGGPDFVCQGRARIVSCGLAKDFAAAALDFLPLANWVRARSEPVILHAHTRVGSLLSTAVGRVIGCRVVLQQHALWQNPGFHKKLQRITQARMIYNSRKTCRHFGADPENSFILMPPCRWPETPNQHKNNSPRIVAAGAFIKQKNFDALIQAFNSRPLFSEATELHIWGLADPPADPAHQGMITKMAAQNSRIHLHAWAADWTRHLTSSDIVVHLGQPEGFGMVMLEGFAAGCRLVVLKDTFLDDLPEPLRSAGIVRLPGVMLEPACQGLERALALDWDGMKMWKARATVAGQFNLALSAARLQGFYRSMVSNG